MRSKIIALLWFAAAATTVRAQQFTPQLADSIDFVITGTTTSTNDSVAAFPCASHGATKKYPLVEGKFTVSGRLPRHTFLQIGDYEGNDLRFIINEVPTHIHLVTGDVKGSALQEKFIQAQLRERDIDKQVSPWWKRLSDEDKERIYAMVEGEVQAVTPQDSALLENYTAALTQRRNLVRQILRENPDNLIPAWYLYVHTYDLSYAELQEFLRPEAPYAYHPAMERLWRVYREKTQQLRLTNQTAPDFTATAPDGSQRRLSDYLGKGHYVLLDFWASWCGPCIGTFPYLKRLYAQYHDRGLTILGVSNDKDRSKWLKALERHQLPWPALLSSIQPEENALDRYGVETIPNLVLISPQGKVVAADLSKTQLADLLQQLLGEADAEP